MDISFAGRTKSHVDAVNHRDFLPGASGLTAASDSLEHSSARVGPAVPKLAFTREAGAISRPKDHAVVLEGLWPERSQIQSFAPQVSITNTFGANNVKLLGEHHITHILVCAGELPMPYPHLFVYRRLEKFYDNANINLHRHIEHALPWIMQAVAAGGRVLLHCAAGSSRSGAIAVAYLMATQHLCHKEALETAQKARPTVAPNSSFQE